jgi:hypothetical protein
VTFIIGQRGATSWGFQIGRHYLNVGYSSFWLYSRPRANYIRNGYRPVSGPNRGWLYAWPLQFGWERDS